MQRVAFSNIGDFLDEKGEVKPADLSPEAASALHSYRTRADGSVYGIRLHNKIRALKVFSKYLGLLDPP